MREWLNIDGISYIPSTVLLTGIAKVALKDNRLFAVLDTKGDCPLVYRAELGFYRDDTRYLSNWEMSVNNEQLVYLSHRLLAQGNSCIFSMTNRDIPTLDGKSRIARDTLLIRRILTFYEDNAFEHLEFNNYDVFEHELEVQQIAQSRFDDIFEVRGLKRPLRGEILESGSHEGPGRKIVRLGYRGLDNIVRHTHIQPVTDVPEIAPDFDTVTLTYRIKIPPKSRRDLKTIISFDEPHHGNLMNEPFAVTTTNDHLQNVERYKRKEQLGDLKLSSDNPIFDRCLRNAGIDIEMLTTIDDQKGLYYPYAGIPWFAAPFGRDGIITAYQLLPWYPRLAHDVLEYVFASSGTKVDPFTDEEPGKIFHEMRRGEMANLKEIPYIPYFGSVDSTPLALILLGEYYSWTRDIENLRKWWPRALSALEWIERWGDRDQDLFIEYMKSAPTGLDNQGWKDSHNSVMHKDGELARPPIKICEVQAYAYRARRVLSQLALVMGDAALSERLITVAKSLQQRFREKFWDPDENYIYLALDGSNKPCEVMSSNMGHALWGQILTHEEAAFIANHLISPRLFSGYGIRTLASDEKSYNPLSYHNGSIWPHDNSLIIEGFRYYDRSRQMQTAADALFDVLMIAQDHRLPELFCGFTRRKLEPPIPYEVACRPQGWAAGSVFLLLKSLLGFMCTPNQDVIAFNSPLLPEKVNLLEIQNVRVWDTEFSAVIKRGENTCHIEITKRSGPRPIVVVK